jgi:hypothetical protein
LVKWKNQPTSENSWVSESKFDTIEIINKYWASLNSKSKVSNSIIMTPLNLVFVSLFLLLFCCTSASAQLLISENLPFCDMTKTPNLIDMYRSCHHSRAQPLRPPFFKKRTSYKHWNAPDDDDIDVDDTTKTPTVTPSASLVSNINVIAPKTNKIHGTGWQCHMYKMYTIYYKTFLQDEIIQNEWTEAVSLTPDECELMVRNKRCHNFDMVCSDVNSCHYEGVRIPNYGWLKTYTGVVYNCNYYKRTIVAADSTSNLFGIIGCTADKLF